MFYLLMPGPNFTAMYLAETSEQLAFNLEVLNPVPGTYIVVEDLSSLPTGWESFPQGVVYTVSPPNVSYDLSIAKTYAKRQVGAQISDRSNNVVLDLPPLLLTAQAALPEGERLPVFNAAFTAYDALVAELQSYFTAIDAATSVGELNEILNPPTGIINTGRGLVDSLDLNPSYYVEFNSSNIPASDTELFVPGTSTVIPYLPDQPEAPYCFDSLGDCFAPGDYRIQIRVASTGVILTEFEVPVAPGNLNISF